MPYAGTVRIRWQIKSGQIATTATITVSGSIATCSDGALQRSYKTGSCDLFVVAGDLIRVSVKSDTNGLAYMRKVRVYYNVVNSPGTGSVLND